MQGVYIALGSNLGDRRANLQRALSLMAPDIAVTGVSPVYETRPQPPAPPPAFYNAVCRVETALEPEALLDRLKGIEVQAGRRPSEYWAPRVLDLDLILYDNRVVQRPRLSVPHPRLAERLFVLLPLLDLDPGLVHPETGLLLADLASSLQLEGITRSGEI